MTQRFITQL